MAGWMDGWKGDEFPTKVHGDVRLCKGFWLTGFMRFRITSSLTLSSTTNRRLLVENRLYINSPTMESGWSPFGHLVSRRVPLAP